jgi:hypothetical protein
MLRILIFTSIRTAPTQFLLFSFRSINLESKRSRELKYDAQKIKLYHRYSYLRSVVPNHPLVGKPLIETMEVWNVQGPNSDIEVDLTWLETMEVWNVQGPNSDIEVVGDYLHADGKFGGKDKYLNQIWSSREKYGLQLYAQTAPMW